MLFHAKVNWYNDYTNEDVVDYVVVITNSWNGAVEKINQSFDCINSINLEVINDESDVLSINEKWLDELKEINVF